MKDYLLNKILAKLPLRIIFIIPFVLQISGIVGLVGYLSYQSGQKTVEDLGTQLMDEVGDRVKKNLQLYLQTPHQINQVNLIQIELNLLNLQNLYPWEKYLWRQIQIHPDMAYIAITTDKNKQRSGEKLLGGSLHINLVGDDVGMNFYSFNVNEKGDRTTGKLIIKNYDLRQHPSYQKAVRAGKSSWSDVFVSLLEPTLLISALEPIYNPNKQVVGVLLSTLRLDQIGHFLSTLKIGKSGQTFIIEKTGKLLATSTGEIPFRSVKGEKKLFLATESKNPITRATAQYLNRQFSQLKSLPKNPKIKLKIQQENYFLSLVPFRDSKGLEWLIVIVVPENDFLGQIKANNQTTFLLGLCAFFVALLMSLLTARWVIKPILKLNQASKNIARGEWNQTTEVNRYDELGELETSFNFMANKLKESFSILQENEHRLNQFLDAVPIGITVHEPTGKIYYMNRKCLEILQIKAILNAEKEDLSRTYRIYKQGTNQFYPTEELPIIRALAGETIYLDDLQIYQPEKIILLEIWATPIYNHQGEIIYAIAAFQDISQRKQTEQTLADYNHTLETQVKQRTTELAEAKDKAEVANRAKGIFLANMSHELRTPLNIILGFTQIMNSSQTLSPKDRENIKSINNSGEDLLKLINNILSFTKTEVETINPNFDQEIYVDTQTNLKTFNLTVESFSGMSLEWIEQLYQAISSLDEPLIFGLIEKIPPEKQELSEELKYWVDHFRFDLIFNVLENMIQKS